MPRTLTTLAQRSTPGDTQSPRPTAKRPAAHPAHRPSRRNEIVDAAIRLFARKGFVDAAISDVAEEADVVVTAVYYHFSGKEELFTAAVHKVFDSISAVVSEVREGSGADEGGTVGDTAAGDDEMLDRVIDAVWGWIDTHPDEATLVHLQLPGATRQISTLRQEFEDLHVRRAFGYLGPAKASRSSAARRAEENLAVRTLVDVLISVHTMRLADGPLSGEPGGQLRTALHGLAHRLVRIE